MREFVKGHTWVQWNQGNKSIICTAHCLSKIEPDNIGEDATREEFVEMAMRAIEKMREAGITINTDWLPKWGPKEGDVCWFWDGEDSIINIGIFREKDDSDYCYKADGGRWYQHCAPFTGELPEPFKSRWEAEKP